MNRSANTWIEQWLMKLKERHREVICRRFGLLGYEATTLRAISDEIGLTRERIRQIQVDALKKLRIMLEQDGMSFTDLPDRFTADATITSQAA